jgi:ABC-type transport system substrate-binding protein
MNNKTKPFDDLHVRKAIALALDRKHIVDTYFYKGSSVADFFTPCLIANGCVGEPWYKTDVAAAKAELALATDPTVRNGFKIPLFLRDRVRPYQPQPQQEATEIKQQLKTALNIDVDIQIQESATFLTNHAQGKLPGLFLIGWIADYPHITDYLDYHFGKNSVIFGDSSPEIYNLLQTADTMSVEGAKDTYVKANKAVMDVIPMVPIAYGVSGAAFKADVKGAYADGLANEKFALMDPGGRDTFIWLQSAEPPSLYCNDEDDGEAIRACEQISEALYAFKPNTTDLTPALATECKSPDQTVWTCTIRPGVKWSDGSALTAHDVVASFAVAWDASIPIHKGDSGTWTFMDGFFGLINKPK